MKKLLYLLLVWGLLGGVAAATDVTIQETAIPNFNPRGLGTDTAIIAGVTNGLTTITSAGAFRPWVGLGGFRIAINGTAYYVDYVTDANTATLTTAYAGGTSAAASLTWYKWVELRIYVDPGMGNFQPLGKSYIVQTGAVNSGAWYRRVACSVVTVSGVNTLYLPQLTGQRALDATTDSPTNNLAQYVAAFYMPGGAFLQYYDCFKTFQLPATTPTTWGAICTYNNSPVIAANANAYTQAQIDARFPPCPAGQLAYYMATGNVQSCLPLGTGLSISGGALTSTGGGGGGSGTVNAGTAMNLAYYATSTNAVSTLPLGSNLTISGGVLKTQQLKSTINAVDYGADPTGAANSTSALNAWGAACLAAGGYDCYLPTGSYLTDTLSFSLNTLNLRGDGNGRSVLVARTAGNPVFNITGSNYLVNFSIRGIGFRGQGKTSGAAGHCVVLNDPVNGASQFVIEDNAFTNCGGDGLRIPVMFAGRIVGNLFDEIGGTHARVQGGVGTVIARNDFKTVEAGQVALWVYSGNALIQGNNGIEPDSGAGAIWGRFGQSTAAGDATDSYFRGALVGNNIEQFKDIGLQFRSNSSASFDANTWNSPTSGSVRALYFEFVAGTETAYFTGTNQFNLQGAATWANGQPIHARSNAPFLVIGTTNVSQFYDWNAAVTNNLPNSRSSLDPGTTNYLYRFNRASVSEYFQYAGTTSPGVSASGTARAYFDSATNKLKCSENGGAYVDCVGGGGGGAATGNLYQANTGATYTRLLGTAFLDANAAGSAQAINLGTPAVSGDVSAVEVRKSDTSANVVTVAFGASTLRLTAPGQSARFVPGLGGWRVWSQDMGSQAPDGAAFAFTTSGPATFARPSDASYVDANAGGGALTVTLGTSGGFPVEVRKSDLTTNVVTVDYATSTFSLSTPGAYVKLVPNGSGGWVVWSTDATGGGYAANGTYASNTSTTYSPAGTVGFIDADATSGSQVITLPTATALPVEVRKSDTSANTVTVNYGAGTVVLNAPGRWVRLVPNASAWVIWAGN